MRLVLSFERLWSIDNHVPPFRYALLKQRHQTVSAVLGPPDSANQLGQCLVLDWVAQAQDLLVTWTTGPICIFWARCCYLGCCRDLPRPCPFQNFQFKYVRTMVLLYTSQDAFPVCHKGNSLLGETYVYDLLGGFLDLYFMG